MELSDIQKEVSPRISAADLLELLKNKPDQVLVIDLRSPSEFNRAHIENSINISFTSVMLGDRRLEALNVQNLAKRMEGRITVVVSVSHENACLVRSIKIYLVSSLISFPFQFAEFLVDCQIPYVAILHKGFNILHSINPGILISS